VSAAMRCALPALALLSRNAAGGGGGGGGCSIIFLVEPNIGAQCASRAHYIRISRRIIGASQRLFTNPPRMLSSCMLDGSGGNAQAAWAERAAAPACPRVRACGQKVASARACNCKTGIYCRLVSMTICTRLPALRGTFHTNAMMKRHSSTLRWAMRKSNVSGRPHNG
jgi:hypothetical protein